MCHSSLGGSVRMATELSKEMARREHSVHLFTLGVPFGGWGNADGLCLHAIPPQCTGVRHPSQFYTEWLPGEVREFKKCVLDVIGNSGLDILHFHYAVPFAFLAADIKDLLGEGSPKLVGTLHGTDVSVFGCNPLKGPRLSQALRKLDALTTVSASHAKLASKVFGFTNPPKVIYNFIDPSRFQPADRVVQAKLPAHHPGRRKNGRKTARIVHVSNLRSVKNPESVANIFLGIRKLMDAELWLIGEGPGIETIRSIVKSEGYGSDLVFWGLCDNVAPILSNAHLLLMPSLSESFCLAALEAMACGVPVLATDVGGLPEIVAHGKTGFLFSPGNYPQAVAFAVQLLSDEAMRLKMANAAIVSARRFDREEIVTSYENLYYKLIRGARKPVDKKEIKR